MAQYVYTMRRVAKTVPPKRTILKNISLNFFPGAKIGVLGLNGSGKSSLLRIMAGVDENYDGEVIRMPGMRVGYLEQEPKLPGSATVRAAVEEAMGDVAAAKKRLDEIYAAYAEPDADFDQLAEEQARLEAMINAGGADELEVAADALRLPPWEQKVDVLSGGEKRRVALCRLLLSRPDMLLLDEPTNHLDAESVEWLEQFLTRFPGTVVGVTHDRYFLDNAAEWILELDRGYGIPWKGNYSSWLEQKQERIRLEEKSESKRQKTLERELEWIRMSPKARQSKGQARLNSYEKLLNQEAEQRREDLEIYIPPGPRLGDVVFEFKDLTKSFDERLILDHFSAIAPPGSIIGIVGPNGVGKTTLLRMMVGKEKPDSGTIKIGDTVKLAYVDQSRTLDPEKTVYEEISQGAD